MVVPLKQKVDLDVHADSEGVIGPGKKAMALNVDDVVKDSLQDDDAAVDVGPGGTRTKRKGKRVLALQSWADRYAIWKVNLGVVLVIAWSQVCARSLRSVCLTGRASVARAGVDR